MRRWSGRHPRVVAHHLELPPHRHVVGRARRELPRRAAPRTTTPTRLRRQVHGGRRDRAAVLRRTAEGLELDPAALPGQQDASRWPELRQILTDKFLSKTRDEWTKIFDGTDACTTPVLTFTEARTIRTSRPRQHHRTRRGHPARPGTPLLADPHDRAAAARTGGHGLSTLSGAEHLSRSEPHLRRSTFATDGSHHGRTPRVSARRRFCNSFSDRDGPWQPATSVAPTSFLR